MKERHPFIAVRVGKHEFWEGRLCLQSYHRKVFQPFGAVDQKSITVAFPIFLTVGGICSSS